jgi:hypothetical protein
MGPLPEVATPELARWLFLDCLFDVPSADRHGCLAPPLCKRSQARLAAFDLLWDLALSGPPAVQEVRIRGVVFVMHFIVIIFLFSFIYFIFIIFGYYYYYHYFIIIIFFFC